MHNIEHFISIFVAKYLKKDYHYDLEYMAIRLTTTLTICSIFLAKKSAIYGGMAIKRIAILVYRQ